jgi:CHAD domain-containing protein
MGQTKAMNGLTSTELPDPTSGSVGAEQGAAAASAEPSSEQRTDWVTDWMKVRELALKQLNRFIALEPKVLKGDDPDAVHDLRVASRRLQQVLDLLYPTPPKEMRRLRRRIKSARRALSEVRNYDAHLARVSRSLARKRISRPEAWEAVRNYLTDRRAESFEKAQRKLSKANLAVAYVRLKEHLDWGTAAAARNGHVHAPPRPIALPEELASEPFWQRAQTAIERVWRAYETQVTDSQRDPQAPVLHGVRIATKRLRYLVEVLCALDVAGCAEILGPLRRLQRHLGEWHDLETFDQVLVDMVARPKFLRDHLETVMAVEKLMLRNRRAKKAYVDKYYRMTLDSRESQQLKDWIDNLLSKSSAVRAEA